MPTLHPAFVLAAMLLCLAPPESFAQGTNRRPPMLLSKIELRACMLREDALKSRDESMKAAQQEHMESVSSLAEEAKALAEILRSLADTNEAVVDAYNARNAARNAKVEIHNKRTDAMNQAIAQLQSDQADFMNACVARPYLRADKDALLKELGRPPDKGEQRLPPPPIKLRGTGTST